MTQNSNLLGVILAGGLSKRMNKENKFFKTLNKKTLLEIIINKAVSQIPKLVINLFELFISCVWRLICENRFENSSEEISLTAKISISGLSSSLICIEASVIPSPGIKLENISETFSDIALFYIKIKQKDINKNFKNILIKKIHI